MKPSSVTQAHWGYLALAIGSLGCQATPRSAAATDLRVFQREQSAETLLERGQAFAVVGDTIRAQEYLSAALDAGGSEREILPLLLSVCVRDGRYRLAIDYARDHLRRQPSDHRLRFILGTLYLSLDDFAAAERELRTAAAGDRDNPDVQYAFGALLRDHAGNAGEASAHFQLYLELAPRGEHADEARAALQAEQP